MTSSKAVEASVLIALIAGIAVTEATRERLTVRNHVITFKIDCWDDGRTDPYRVWPTTNAVSSKYTFDAARRLPLLYVDEAGHAFSNPKPKPNPKPCHGLW